jgi:hypothetical protein
MNSNTSTCLLHASAKAGMAGKEPGNDLHPIADLEDLGIFRLRRTEGLRSHAGLFWCTEGLGSHAGLSGQSNFETVLKLITFQRLTIDPKTNSNLPAKLHLNL